MDSFPRLCWLAGPSLTLCATWRCWVPWRLVEQPRLVVGGLSCWTWLAPVLVALYLLFNRYVLRSASKITFCRVLNGSRKESYPKENRHLWKPHFLRRAPLNPCFQHDHREIQQWLPFATPKQLQSSIVAQAGKAFVPRVLQSTLTCLEALQHLSVLQVAPVHVEAPFFDHGSV